MGSYLKVLLITCYDHPPSPDSSFCMFIMKNQVRTGYNISVVQNASYDIVSSFSFLLLFFWNDLAPSKLSSDDFRYPASDPGGARSKQIYNPPPSQKETNLEEKVSAKLHFK